MSVCYLVCMLGSQLLGATQEDKAGSLSAPPADVMLYKIGAHSWLLLIFSFEGFHF